MSVSLFVVGGGKWDKCAEEDACRDCEEDNGAYGDPGAHAGFVARKNEDAVACEGYDEYEPDCGRDERHGQNVMGDCF